MALCVPSWVSALCTPGTSKAFSLPGYVSVRGLIALSGCRVEVTVALILVVLGLTAAVSALAGECWSLMVFHHAGPWWFFPLLHVLSLLDVSMESGHLLRLGSGYHIQALGGLGTELLAVSLLPGSQ